MAEFRLISRTLSKPVSSDPGLPTPPQQTTDRSVPFRSLGEKTSGWTLSMPDLPGGGVESARRPPGHLWRSRRAGPSAG
jgi:hypothetical protein